MNIRNAIEMLQEMLEDSGVPKNVRTRLEKTIEVLQQKEENKIKISRALHELEEISNDTNMQADTRTQLFNVVSVLEIG
ncbi:hypothetical protein GF358_00045 [Candidatus Woesearchaeota archaeon]|nr:hypothetical protein [Candidatus Woesearchaeota archaeon]